MRSHRTMRFVIHQHHAQMPRAHCNVGEGPAHPWLGSTQQSTTHNYKIAGCSRTPSTTTLTLTMSTFDMQRTLTHFFESSSTASSRTSSVSAETVMSNVSGSVLVLFDAADQCLVLRRQQYRPNRLATESCSCWRSFRSRGKCVFGWQYA